jgi:lipopolysaccharide export LptBFGC system permease protein LptF
MYGRLMIATLAIMAVLAGHEMFYKTKDLYRLVLSNVITVNELLIVWAALMPVVVYHIGPQMVAIALLARYYLWRQHNEVLTFRTMGLSCWQIALPGIATGACMALFAASMSLYALPRSVTAADSIRAVAQTRIAPHMLEEGVPNIIVPGLSISFDRWLSADVVEKVVLTDDRKPNEFTFVNADRGRFLEKDGTHILVLEAGTHFTRDTTGEVKRVTFTELTIPLTTVAQKSGGAGFYEQSIGWLLDPPDEVRQDPRLFAACVIEGHHRIINPLRCIGCALLLLGVLVPGLQGYGELFVRLGIAVGLAFGENSASTIAFATAPRHAEAAPLLYLLPVVSGCAGALLLSQGDRHLQRHMRRLKFWRGWAPPARPAVRQPGLPPPPAAASSEAAALPPAPNP